MNFKLLIFFFLIAFSSYGQNKNSLDSDRQKKADSLNLLIKIDTNSVQKAKHILKLSQLLRSSDKIKSRKLAKSVLKMNFNKNADSLKSVALLRIGVSYFKEKKDSIALVYFIKMDSLHKATNKVFPSLMMSKVYRSEISKFTFTKEGILQAKQFLNEGIHLAQSINNKKYENLMIYRIGDWMSFYSKVEKPKIYLDSANYYFNKALRYYKATNNNEYISKIYYSLASVASIKKDYKRAEYYYKLRLTEIEKTKDSIDIGNAYASLGSFYRKTKNYKKAIEELEKAKAINKKYGADDIETQLRLTHDLALTNYASKNYKEASNYFRTEMTLRDSLFEQSNARQVIQIEKKYKTKEKEQEISLLKSQNKIVEQQKKNQRNIIIAGLSVITLVSAFLFMLFRNRKKTTTKLQELDNVKSNFFANISHEFRTPLTLISNPIEDTLENENLSDKKRQQFETAKRNTNRLLELVNQLLDLSKIDAGQLKLNIQKSNAINFLSVLCEAFSFSAKQKNISYILNISPYTKDVYFDKDALEKIVINLISNAIKYTPKNGAISCDAFIKNEELQIKIKNSGKGLTKNQIETIFQRFYQTHPQNQGTGIGLALVKELLDLHKGTITVESKENGNTIFIVKLPVDKHSFKNEDFILSQKNPFKIVPNITQTSINEDEEFIDTEQPIILIVEDNDDVRLLLKQTFEADYNTITASNGEKGIDMALEHIPDLIISDIMMPVKDGIALTTHLKNDERTSHIPIILLTAKAGDDNELLGVEVGADDYITKPFNSKLLITKATKLIENRRLLQQRYSQELVLYPKDIAVTNIDEQFLEKIQTILDDNLLESSFSVTQFSEAAGMSRMQLHRKLKALTGLTATEFVRSQRLKLAAKLLLTSDINISQVGYSVGFNDHSYFAKCFKEVYNCTPTEYSKRK